MTETDLWTSCKLTMTHIWGIRPLCLKVPSLCVGYLELQSSFKIPVLEVHSMTEIVIRRRVLTLSALGNKVHILLAMEMEGTNRDGFQFLVFLIVSFAVKNMNLVNDAYLCS
jgi:hypothetical protein